MRRLLGCLAPNGFAENRGEPVTFQATSSQPGKTEMEGNDEETKSA